MDIDEYRQRGKELVDYIADYLKNIRQRRVFPDVKPGYMRSLLSDSAPQQGESWEKIFSDVERVVMPGVTHWQSPYMHAYFPALNSFPSLLGDMLADAINCLGFTWASSPACTELESIVMDWLGKMIGLPDVFLHTKPESKGGGVIQTTASEATFICLLAARTEAIRRCYGQYPDLEDAEINGLLVAYCSDQAHSSVEKAGLMGLVKMRYIESDHKFSLRGEKLVEAIRRDREKGLIPFFDRLEVLRSLGKTEPASEYSQFLWSETDKWAPKPLCATLGTTGCCAFDNLKELGHICKNDDIWLHVDAAYAGTAFICPEFRKWLTGIEYAQSIAFNPSKWMMVHFDCTAMWVQNSEALHRTFNVDPLYLKHENSGLAIDYMHWQIPLSKRFRSLKLWFVIRNFGINGLQNHVRKGVQLAMKFESLIRSDDSFEIPADRHLGMVVFRLKGENQLTEVLLKKLNSSGQLHCVPASLKGTYVIRFTVTSASTTEDDILRDWKIIRETAKEILKIHQQQAKKNRANISEIKLMQPEFGTSLLLANSPMSPKVVNGSYVAIFETPDVMKEFAKKFRNLRPDVRDSPAIRCRIRGMLMSGKQYSLDSHMDLVQTIVSSTLPVTREDSIDVENNGESSEGCQVQLIDTGADKSSQTSPDSSNSNNSGSRGRSRSVHGDQIGSMQGRSMRGPTTQVKVTIAENGTHGNDYNNGSPASECVPSGVLCTECGHRVVPPPEMPAWENKK